MTAKPADDLLFWIDLEMTGLDPDTCTIIEIASLLTDNELNIVAEGPALVVHQPEEALVKMDDWNQKHHKESGLYKAVLESRISLAEAEAQTLAFAKEWLNPRKAPLCGNSVWQDRRFLCRYMPTFEAHLHYRNIDVSSFKEAVKRWYPKPLHPPRSKKEAHRALDDIRESIAELKLYKQRFFVPANALSPMEGVKA